MSGEIFQAAGARALAEEIIGWKGDDRNANQLRGGRLPVGVCQTHILFGDNQQTTFLILIGLRLLCVQTVSFMLP